MFANSCRDNTPTVADFQATGWTLSIVELGRNAQGVLSYSRRHPLQLTIVNLLALR